MSLPSFVKFAALALAFAPAVLSAAAPASPVALKGEVKLEKTVVENGVERIALVAPDVVVPGDKLVFSTAYSNTGATPAVNFVVTNALPSGVALAPDAAAATLAVSVDGGKSWGKLAALKVADGQGGIRAALASDATHVRWTLPVIAPGASGTLKYHAIVR